MLATPHLLTGAAIGAATENYYLAFILGVISHHILDLIPHFDTAAFHIGEKEKGYKLNKRDWIVGIGDAIIGAIILLILAANSASAGFLLAGALGGIFTDLFDNVPFWKEVFQKTKIGKKVHSFHGKYHFEPTQGNWWAGLIGSGTVIVVALWILLK